MLYDLYERKQSNYHVEMENFLEVTRYSSSIVRLDDLVDDTYAYEGYDFKKLIQTDANLSNFAMEFLKFKNLLVRVSHFSYGDV